MQKVDYSQLELNPFLVFSEDTFLLSAGIRLCFRCSCRICLRTEIKVYAFIHRAVSDVLAFILPE